MEMSTEISEWWSQYTAINNVTYLSNISNVTEVPLTPIKFPEIEQGRIAAATFGFIAVIFGVTGNFLTILTIGK